MRKPLLATLALLPILAACGPTQEAPTIAFLGVAKGDLRTDVNVLEYADRFDVTDRDLVGVVAFDTALDGMDVTASWFMPDDRSPPIGRTTITTSSGAKVARFSFANQKNWQKGPYQFQIMTTVKKGNDRIVTGSGSVRFYINMTDAQIQEYLTDYTEWERRRAEQQSAVQAQEDFEKTLVDDMNEEWNSSDAVISFRRDLTGDGKPEYGLVDASGLPAIEPPTSAALLLDAAVRSLSIRNRDGDSLLDLRIDGSRRGIRDSEGSLLQELPRNLKHIRVAVLATGSIIAQWQGGTEVCTSELPLRDGEYGEAATECR